MKKEHFVALNILRFSHSDERTKFMLSEFSEHKAFPMNFKDSELKSAFYEIEKAEKLGISILTIIDENYPKLLRTIKDPPLVIYVKGSCEVLNRPSVSMVGSRKCTEYGKGVSFSISYELSKSGICIVSGLAYGIDSEAHRGALEAGGQTVAILGCGVNVVYPLSNRKLYQRIVSQGAVISEFPLDTKPKQFHFPFRNRLISGISLASIVVEAEERSGSLITANYALEQGREVFAVPGNISSKYSKGTNKLIRDGAIPLLSSEDVFSVKGLESLNKEKKLFDEFTEEESAMLEMLENSKLTLDEIQNKTGMQTSCLLEILTMLEFKGYVRRDAGRFLRVK